MTASAKPRASREQHPRLQPSHGHKQSKHHDLDRCKRISPRDRRGLIGRGRSGRSEGPHVIVWEGRGESRTSSGVELRRWFHPSSRITVRVGPISLVDYTSRSLLKVDTHRAVNANDPFANLALDGKQNRDSSEESKQPQLLLLYFLEFSHSSDNSMLLYRRIHS